MSNILDDLLSLLAAVIIADKRVYSEEIKSFGQTASRMDWIQEHFPDFSEAKALEWYEFNKDRLIKHIHNGEFEDWLHDCLNRLSAFMPVAPVLEAIQVISNSDGEYHVSEKALRELTRRNW